MAFSGHALPSPCGTGVQLVFATYLREPCALAEPVSYGVARWQTHERQLLFDPVRAIIMPANVITRLRPSQSAAIYFDAAYGVQGSMDDLDDVRLQLHSRQSSVTTASTPGSMELGSSPASNTTAPTAASGSRIGRPPQWTVSRSRKLARLYLFSTLSIEKIIKVLEEDGFSPRCGRMLSRP